MAFYKLFLAIVPVVAGGGLAAGSFFFLNKQEERKEHKGSKIITESYNGEYGFGDL